MTSLKAATCLTLLSFGQPADTVEAPLIIALFWGFLPAVLAFIIGCFAWGRVFARRRILWLGILLGLLYLTWLLLCNVFVMEFSGELDSVIMIYGGIGVSWIVGLSLLLVPLKPSKTDKSKGHHVNSPDRSKDQLGA